MEDFTGWVISAIGVLIILYVLWDIFETLFDPEDQGSITDFVVRVVWFMFRMVATTRSGGMSYGGPVAYLLVLITWAGLMTIGWALLYWPQLPDGFLYSSGLDATENAGFLDAIYVSFVTVATLGYGDITPVSTWLRLIAPMQALAGFLLLSGAITWLLSIYGDLEVRRSLAHETTLLREGLERTGLHLSELESSSVERLLDAVTSRIVLVHGSLTQFPITYTFRTRENRQSLAVMALYLHHMTTDFEEEEDVSPEVRLRIAILRNALRDLAQVLASRFLQVPENSTTLEILEAYAEDHKRPKFSWRRRWRR